jgi:hypothetical protein
MPLRSCKSTRNRPTFAEAVPDFYRGVTAKALERFDDKVSAEPTFPVIGSAPREWVTERARPASRDDRPRPRASTTRGCDGPVGVAVHERRFRWVSLLPGDHWVAMRTFRAAV